MHAKYHPAPETAACPHCNTVFPLVVSSPALDWFCVWLTCTACGTHWKEKHSMDGAILRFWSRAKPQPAA
jgi:hypothetical protein